MAAMHPEIAKRFKDLEMRRKALVARVRALPADKQNAKPIKGFSPVEIVMHFALAESSNNAFLKRHPPSSLKGKKPHVTFIFKNTVKQMQNPVKVLPTVPYMIPKGPVDLAEADRAWDIARKELGSFLEHVQSPDEPFIKFLFFFGIGSASDYLTLLEAHMNYHEVRFPE